MVSHITPSADIVCHRYATLIGTGCVLYCKYEIILVVIIRLPTICTSHACHCFPSLLAGRAFLDIIPCDVVFGCLHHLQQYEMV